MKPWWGTLACVCLAACGGSATGPEDDASADGEVAVDAPGEGDVPGPDVEEEAEVEAEAEADASEDEPGEETTPPVCPVADDLGRGDHTQTMWFGGQLRGYIVHVPDPYDPATPAALVLNMHGFMSANWQQVLFSDMNTTADREGFVAVYPDGVSQSWNAGTCCGLAATTNVDDVGFLRVVVDELSARLCIDRRRVYATGMSNGGYLSHRLGCEASDLFAAIAPVSGAMGISDCSPSRPMPVAAFHGLQDLLVSYEDGRAAIDQWLGLDGCAGDPIREDFGGSRCLTWSGCTDDVEVMLCTLDPMGHCWPGGSDILCLPGIGPFNDDVDANDAMWSFFSRFTLPD